MTGTIVYLHYLGRGEIRVGEILEQPRIKFERSSLVAIPFEDCFGQVVDFDTLRTVNGLEAVRIRRHREPRKASA